MRPRSWAWPSGNAGWRCWRASRTISAPRWNGRWSTAIRPGRGSPGYSADFWLGRGLLQEGRDWLDRALAQRPADLRLRADLLRLLGAVRFEAGDLDGADAVLSEGSEVAAAAGAPAIAARIRVLGADIRNYQGTGHAEALAECEAAAVVLESEDDLDGLAEALTVAGRLLFWLGDIPASQPVLERAISCARQSGNHRIQMRASHWLAVIFSQLSIPADIGVTRTEQLLADASGDLWAEADLLKPLCVLYAHVGRSADARAAIDRSQSIFAGFGAKLALAESAVPAAIVGMIIGDPSSAERYARQGIEEFRAMGERRLVLDLVGLLAHALYEQGRFDEAQQLIDQADTGPWGTVYSTWLTEAKLLARRGQFAAARKLVGQAEALLPPTSVPMPRADALKARAEVERLAGAPGHAAASLRAALDIYEQQRATTLSRPDPGRPGQPGRPAWPRPGITTRPPVQHDSNRPSTPFADSRVKRPAIRSADTTKAPARSSPA